MTQATLNEEYQLYNHKVTLNYAPYKHTYNVDGNVVYGVTGVTELLPKPWMAGYVKKHIKLYFQNGGWDKIANLRDVDELDHVLDEALRASDRYGREMAQLGTNLHRYVQDFLGERMLPDVQDQAELKSFMAFWKFLNQHKLEPIYLERKCLYLEDVGKKLKRPLFAGTVDYIGKVDGVMTLLDWKTSTGIFLGYWLQVAAYAEAINKELKTDKTLLPSPIKQVMVVNLKKTGELKVEARKQWKDEFDIFLSLLKVKQYLSN